MTILKNIFCSFLILVLVAGCGSKKKEEPAEMPSDQKEEVVVPKPAPKKATVMEIKQALKARPENIGLWNALGVTAAGEGDLDLARKSFEIAAQKAPDDEAAFLNLANLALLEEDIPAAVDFFGEVVKINPANVQARRKLEDLALALKRARILNE